MPWSARTRWSQERKDETLTPSRVVTAWVDDGGLIDTVSTLSDPWLGFLPAELIGMPVADLVHPEDVPQLHLPTPTIDESFAVAARVIGRDGSLVAAEVVRHPREPASHLTRIDVMTCD